MPPVAITPIHPEAELGSLPDIRGTMGVGPFLHQLLGVVVPKQELLGGVGLAVSAEQPHERDDAAPPSPMADTLSLEDRGSS